MDSSLPLVSIIVPCRNERAALPAFFASLERQDWPADRLEILIADGMSDDGTREMLTRFAECRKGLKVIDNARRIVSTGLNDAINNASGDVIVRMDVHSEYAENYVRNCVQILLATDAGNVGGAPRVNADTFRERLFGAAFNSSFAVGGARSHNPNYEGYVDTVCFGCWRKETLQQLGMFDETLVRNQDDELNYRLVKSGGKIWQSREIVSWYTPRTNVRDLWLQYFQYGFWKVAVIRKHKLPASIRHLVPAAFVLSNIALAVCLVIARVVDSPPAMAGASLIWFAGAAAYLAATLIFSLLLAGRSGWLLFPFLPVIFAIYHFAYGTGFLTGIVFGPRVAHGVEKKPALFSELSRR